RPAVGIVPLHTALSVAHGQPAWLFEGRQILFNRCCLFAARKARPQWIQGGCIFIPGPDPGFEIVIKEQAASAIPEKLVDPPLSRLGALLPLAGLVSLAQNQAHLFQVLFSLV